MTFPMTWKSTVFVSGAGLLATWLAGGPTPAPAPSAAAPVAAPQVAAPSRQSAEIAQLADRLEQRHRGGETFDDHPSRNLFRFAPRAGARAARASDVSASVSLAPPPSAPPLAIHLSGVAMDRVGEQDVRTAILSTPSGVVLAREGDEVGAGLRVSAIEAESVALTRPDGSIMTVPLSGK